MAPQPLPGGPAWRACRDVAAADLAGHLDPQDDRHVGTPRRTDLQVAAFGRYLVGVDHNARLCHQRQPAITPATRSSSTTRSRSTCDARRPAWEASS